MLDAALHVDGGLGNQPLRNLLERGGSVWTVASDGQSLQARVSPTAHAAVTAAVSPADAASGELAEAWSKVYGRSPNPSDAWDHAIKAVETVLAPVVIPANPKATLGTIVQAVEAKPAKWSVALATSGTIDGVETLVAMLRLMWPNPDRHGGTSQRTPSQVEATAVVQMAVMIVQWSREGVFAVR